MSAVFSSTSRAIVRRQPLVRQQLRRYADNTADKAKQTAEKAKDSASNAASQAKESASNVTSKASEGLSRVQSTAGPAISNAASSVGNTLNSIGGRTGKLIGFVQSLIPPTIYYSKVGMELSKLVFQGQKMSPPSMQQFQSYFTPLLRRLRNPTAILDKTVNTASQTAQTAAQSPEAIVQRIRNLDQATLATVGVITAEALGFFTVGEMLGRLKLVGYHGEVHHEH